MSLIAQLEKKKILLIVLATLLLVLGWRTSPPKSFLPNSVFHVFPGESLQVLSQDLWHQEVIRSPFLFRSFAILFGGERVMKAGQYYAKKPQNAITLAWRIVLGDYQVETVKFTIPEGFTIKDISRLFDARFFYFDNHLFELVAPEGYLFPDTYFVEVVATASSTIKLFQDNFDRKIAPLMRDIEDSGRTLDEIIIMASLLEAEAKTKEDREMASDILWKRLKIGMPLQVDSNMWTYEFAGLPKRPINNPGLVSIETAIYPTKTPYLYFLTGHDGKMHYAKTFDEHKVNIAKYLSR